ncbi:MAG: hypothetical protein ACYC3Q_09875 [Gemmatimonadaceae bacterium]
MNRRSAVAVLCSAILAAPLAAQSTQAAAPANPATWIFDKAHSQVGFSIRLDYGVAWNRAVEGGGMTLSDGVTVDINIEAVRRVGGG